MAAVPVTGRAPEPQCPICSARGGGEALKLAAGTGLVACRECSLVYAWPGPVGELSALYGPQYYTHQSAHWQAGRANWLRALILHRYYGYPLPAAGAQRLPATLAQALAVVLWPLKSRWRTIPPAVPGGRLLDVGCGSGTYLARVRSLGWQVQGIEPDPDACLLAREGLLLDVQCGTLQEQVGADLYDVITFWHSLEHTHDPLRELRDAWRLLRPGGLVLIEAPNWAGAQRRLFGHHWFHLDWPRHRLHFSDGSLRRALSGAGFIDIRVRSVPSTVGVTGSLERIVLGQREASAGRALRHNPVLKAMVWPVEALLAAAGQAGCLAATARKP